MSGREQIEGEEENEWRRKEEKVCLLDSAKETTGSFYSAATAQVGDGNVLSLPHT